LVWPPLSQKPISICEKAAAAAQAILQQENNPKRQENGENLPSQGNFYGTHRKPPFRAKSLGKKFAEAQRARQEEPPLKAPGVSYESWIIIHVNIAIIHKLCQAFFDRSFLGFIGSLMKNSKEALVL
jgi:hypothetical protein